MAIHVTHERSIPVVVLDRQRRRNAFDDAMIQQFCAALDDLARSAPRVLVLRGAGERSFSAGYDIRCIDPALESTEPLPDTRFEAVVHAVERFPAPVVACLNGDAWGGGLDLALACDLRLTRPGARLAMTPCRLGLIYAPSGLERFLHELGPATTRRLFLTGQPLDADEALRRGLVDELVSASALWSRCLELAAAIAANAPLAVQGTRRALQWLQGGRLQGDTELRRVVEQMRRDAIASDDLREGLAAFMGRRAPEFSGR